MEMIEIAGEGAIGTKDPDEIALEDLVAPLTSEVFFERCWERRPLATRGRPPGFFTPLFSMRDVDRVIRYQKPRPGRIDLVTEGGFIRDNFLGADGAADINLVYESYLKGSTIVLSGLDETWEPLAVFSRRLEARLSHPVAVAVYLTPPRFHGLQPHFDTQENVILQVEGTKRWRVYEPVRELPLVEGSYLPVAREQLSAPLLDAELRPGDTLYVPRGFAHEAEAGDSPSLHITLDIHVLTWMDLLSDAVAAMAGREARLRRSLPAGFLSDEGAMRALESGFVEIVELLRREARLADAVGKHAEKLIVRKPPPADGHFSALLADIRLDTPLRKRKASLTRVVEDGGTAGIQFSGNHLFGPAKIAAALRHVAENEVVVPARLPGALSDEERLLLARRLVRVGLLAPARAGGGDT